MGIIPTELLRIPLLPAGPNDWRTQVPDDEAQNFVSFIASPRKPLHFDKCFLVPCLSGRSPATQQLLQAVAGAIDAFFGVEVIVEPPVRLEADVPFRPTLGFGPRYFTEQIISLAQASEQQCTERPERRSRIRLLFTDVDLWHEEKDPDDWVFGLSYIGGDAVASCARFLELPGPEGVMMLRSLKIVLHEFGHTFGMRHCDQYRCLMNGKWDTHEVDFHPVELCAECARKLDHVRPRPWSQRVRRVTQLLSQHNVDFSADAYLTAEQRWAGE